MIQANCKICNSPVTRFIKSTKKWWDWCSNKCMGADPVILAKKAATNLKKFGGHPMQNVECKQRLKDVFIEHYGVDNPSKSEDVKSKMRNTFMKNYGVDNPSKNLVVIEKITLAANKRYSDPKLKKELLDKRRQTYLDKFGVTSNKHFHIPTNSLHLMKDIEWLTDQHVTQKKSLTQIANELNISSTPLSHFLHASGVAVRRHSTSAVQTEITEYIKSITDTELKANDRSILWPKEIDIYLPAYKLGIEVNGVYWHSEEKGKDKNYHVNKTVACEKLGIRLIHIYDSEWGNTITQQIIKSKLAHILGKSTRIFARQCEIKNVDIDECNIFLTSNHLQGKCPSNTKIGLYYKNELCAIATFGVSRFNKKYQWELLRYTSKINNTVVGGLSKIIAYFIKTVEVNSMISYADRRWSVADTNLYNTIGFLPGGVSDPNYKYFKIDRGEINLLSRNQFQKHMLEKKLLVFNQAYTEYENMSLNGYYRIWDCGNLIYTWKNEQCKIT